MIPVPPAPGLKIAFLHLAPIPGDVAANRSALEKAILKAAEAGAGWILTPECCVCGYTFADRIGTNWILPQPDPWMTGLCGLVGRLKVTLFLAIPERDAASGLFHNSVFVIGPEGAVLGRHRKINALKIGSEAWSSPGDRAEPVMVPPVGPVGLLICADAYTPTISGCLKDKGAKMLVSPAAWAPGFHGPETVWETCSRLTGLPLLVCNRTAKDRILDFSQADSVVARDGGRLISFRSETPAIMMVDWDVSTGQPVRTEPEIIRLG
jgi:N-carbamoylputrescine amidase